MAKGQSRVQQLQENVEEIRDIMQENILKAGEREDKLVELNDRAEELLQHSKRFQKSTRRVKEKMDSENSCMPYKNKKVIMIIAGAVVLVIIVIIIIIIATQSQNKNVENKDSG